MSVFLRKQSLKSGTYLSFVESIYYPDIKNTKQKVIKKIGYVEELKKTYVDPIEHFEKEAKELSKASSIKYQESKAEKAPRIRQNRNIGYFLVDNVYKKFKMNQPFVPVSYKSKIKYNIEDVFRFLVYSQIVHPGSKTKEYDLKDIFLEDFNFTSDQMFDAIKRIGENEELLKEYILIRLKEIMNLNTKNAFFDCTNFYFEIDKENDELKRGPEKNNRHDPIIGMGLLMDGNGMPVTYSLYPGNASEIPELHKNLNNLKKKTGLTGRTIITADKGLNCGDNMADAIDNGDGYIISQTVRGASAKTIEWILQDDENDPYISKFNKENELIFKIKSNIDVFPVQVTSKLNGQKVARKLKQKRIIFWSKDYAEKAKHERDKLVEKAKSIIARPSEYLKSQIGNASHYIKSISYNKETGEITSTDMELDESIIEKEKKLDGYYLIVTSEIDMPDEKVIDVYRGLWEIEQTFSIIKGVLKLRPAFAKSKNGLHSHFVVCFLSLIILRLLQKKYLYSELSTDKVLQLELANRRKKVHKIEYQKNIILPVTLIVDFIRNYNAMKVENNYLVDSYHMLIPYIEEKYNISLDRHVLTKTDIEKIFSSESSQHKTILKLNL